MGVQSVRVKAGSLMGCARSPSLARGAFRAGRHCTAGGGEGGLLLVALLSPDCQSGQVVAIMKMDDLQAVAGHWRLTTANPDPDGDPTPANYETRFDLDGDGGVDVVDIMRVAVRRGSVCP